MGERSDCEERVMAEKEYIERDRLYELSYWHGATPTLEDPFPDGVDAVDTNDIDSIPAADVRPVVLCRDCNYWKLSKISPSLHVCTYVCGATFVREAEDFCSRGKKREES